MRPIYVLIIGILGGVIATVMVQTLRPGPEDAPKPGPGGGNARFSLDEDALSIIALASLPDSLAAHQPKVTADVREDGIVELRLTFPKPSDSLPAALLFNPEIVDGDLELAPGDPAPPEGTLDALQQGLRSRILGLAGDARYELAAITTTDQRLGFELVVQEK